MTSPGTCAVWARPVVLVANKAEGMTDGVQLAEFFELGLGEVHARSRLPMGRASAAWSRWPWRAFAPARRTRRRGRGLQTSGVIKLAVAGRPNVGKSTLINTWLGEERLVAFDQPGTTRDAISPCLSERNGQRFELIDTAGLRRKGKVFEAIEKFSVVKTLAGDRSPPMWSCCCWTPPRA